jgi:hypothetical protein
MGIKRRPVERPVEHACAEAPRAVCVFITAGPMIKLCAGGEGDSEGHEVRRAEACVD